MNINLRLHLLHEHTYTNVYIYIQCLNTCSCICMGVFECAEKFRQACTYLYIARCALACLCVCVCARNCCLPQEEHTLQVAKRKVLIIKKFRMNTVASQHLLPRVRDYVSSNTRCPSNTRKQKQICGA